ncbi:hypothetical protein [Fredinandcohnia quinoae]|nr:hypothetical protein [Fredinandcohnia sp. SECRCQ15]
MKKVISKIEANGVMQYYVIGISNKITLLMIGLVVGYFLKTWLF